MSALDVNCFLNIGKSGEEVRLLCPVSLRPCAQLLLLGMQVNVYHTAFPHVPWQGLLWQFLATARI